MARRRKATKAARGAKRTKRSVKRSAKRRVKQARNKLGQFTSKRAKSRR